MTERYLQYPDEPEIRPSAKHKIQEMRFPCGGFEMATGCVVAKIRPAVPDKSERFSWFHGGAGYSAQKSHA